MKKSIRLLDLPFDLIKEIESYNIFTIHDLSFNLNNFVLDSDKVMQIRDAIDKFKYQEMKYELEGYRAPNDYSFIDKKYTLDDLNLSLRSMNALNNANITTVSKLFNAIENMDIYHLENLGTKSLIQVLESVYEIIKNENLEEVIPIYNNKNNIDDVLVDHMDFTKSALESLYRLGLTTLGSIRQAYLNGKLSEMFNYKTLSVIISKFKNFFNIDFDKNYYFFKLYLIEDKYGLITFEDFEKLLKQFNIRANSESLINKLKTRNDLVVENNYIRLPYFIEKLKQAHFKKESEEIILDRFSGKTLQGVADRFNKTRERIRQIVRDRMAQISLFYEEAFVKEYNKYVWHKEVFKRIFKLNEVSYNVVKYLGVKHPFEEEYEFPEDYILELMQQGKIESFNIDEFKRSLPDVFPQRLEIYGKVVEKLTKREFLEYVIEHFIPRDGMHKFDIIKVANKVASDNNLDYYYDKYIDIVTNTIQGLQNVRYYDYSQIDEEAIASFRKILYEVDSVYSCTYFYLKYPELMKKYDIRDGYELHFLLRRYFDEDPEITQFVDFNRQPMLARKGLTFSEFVYAEWKNLKEITDVDDFADDLVVRYGFHRGTLINVINSTLGDFISLRKIYPYEAKLDPLVKDKVKEILKDDFYEISELEKIFEYNGISKDQYQYFSNTWLKELGYKTHDVNYIIKCEFESLKEVFYNHVLNENIYKITKKDHMMRETTLILFIDSLREEYLAFPLKNGKLVTMKHLEEMGVKKEDILKYVEELGKYLKPEEYFTYYSLKKNNYENAHPIFKKMEEYKLDTSLMISFIRNVPGVKKTTKGNLFRISNKPTTIKEFLEHLMETHKFTTLKELRKFIRENYGFSIRIYPKNNKLPSKLKLS